MLRFDDDFKLVLEPKKKKQAIIPETITCPKCKQGTIVKGQTAYGCTKYNKGCNFLLPFNVLREKATGKTMTKELVFEIIQTHGK